MKEEDFDTVLVEFMCEPDDAHNENSPIHLAANRYIAAGLKFVVDEFRYPRDEVLQDSNFDDWIVSLEGPVPPEVSRFVFMCRKDDKPLFAEVDAGSAP